MRGGVRRTALWGLVLAMVLALGPILAGCGVTAAEETEELPVPGVEEPEKPETGMVPEEAPETPAEAAPPLPDAADLPGAAAPAASAPADPAPQPEPEDLPDRVAYVCYDGLYSVDYDPHDFTPGPAGGADLVKSDGTQVFFARLETPELMETWLAGMEEKGRYQVYLSYEGHEGRAAGRPVHAIVYQDETAWHAEAVVDLGKDRGTEDLPMYAVYFTCDGPSREAVWTGGVKAFLDTLRLGKPG